MFDWTVNLGHILQIFAFVGVALSMFYAQKADIAILRNDIRRLESQQATLSEAFSRLGAILTSVAVQDSRIGMIEKHIDELRHGKGLIE